MREDMPGSIATPGLRIRALRAGLTLAILLALTACTDGPCGGSLVHCATWYRDADGDGYGDPDIALVSCTIVPGSVPVAGDCDDTDSAVGPDAAETCNGRDDNCNGLVDEKDADGDTVPDCVDPCPLDHAKIAPGNCGCGVPETDSDGDGVPDCHDACNGFNDTIDSDGDGVADGCDQRLTYGFFIDSATNLNSFVIRVHVEDVLTLTNPSGGDGAGTEGWCDADSFNDLGAGDYSLLCFHPSPTGGISGRDIEFARFAFDCRGPRPDCSDIRVVSTAFVDQSVTTLTPSVSCRVLSIP